jgi:cell division protease FtsH
MSDTEEAIDRVLMGPAKKNRILTEEDRRVFAYHEAGHAVAAYFLPHGDPVHKVTIIGRGLAGGYTMTLPDEERFVTTRAKLYDDLVDLLAGRAAEEIAIGEISTGAHNDLERVTKTARKMVMEWGMSDRLGPLTFGRPSGEDLVFLGRDISRDRNYSEEVAAAIDQEVREIVDNSYQRAMEILTQHRDKLDAVAQALLEKETLTREEFEAIMEGRELENIEEVKVPVTEVQPEAYKGKETNRVRERGVQPTGEPVIGME